MERKINYKKKKEEPHIENKPFGGLLTTENKPFVGFKTNQLRHCFECEFYELKTRTKVEERNGINVFICAICQLDNIEEKLNMFVVFNGAPPCFDQDFKRLSKSTKLSRDQIAAFYTQHFPIIPDIPIVPVVPDVPNFPDIPTLPLNIPGIPGIPTLPLNEDISDLVKTRKRKLLFDYLGDESDDDQNYCLCQKPSEGEMIACDNQNCAIGQVSHQHSTFTF